MAAAPPQNVSQNGLRRGVAHGIVDAGQMATRYVPDLVSDDSKHLLGGFGPHQQTRIEEQVLSTGDEGVERLIADQKNAHR